MNRVGYGKSHKIKGSMQMGLWYPVLRDEMIPGDIVRINPEVFIQSVVPPVAQLTDKIKYKIEFAFVPNRLVDDTFVRNITTTKDGTVKGDFKTWKLSQIYARYGSASHGNNSPVAFTSSGSTSSDMAYVPKAFKQKRSADAESSYAPYVVDRSRVRFKAGISGITDGYYNECMPVAIKSADKNKIRCAPFFGQGSLMDWLSLEPNANFGLSGKINSSTTDYEFNTWAISSYYMLMNFWHTKPEYEKYIAPYFDYVPVGRANPENRVTLHRYETLEEEFGNKFEEPRFSNRCYNGLCIDNWSDDYFSKTMKTPQRGIAPVVPVTLTGTAPLIYSGSGSVLSGTSGKTINTASVNGNSYISDGSPSVNYFGITNYDASSSLNTAKGGFVISDLRSALALQHFQEDTQDCFKWSDWLQKVYGISPSDNTLDEPEFLGAKEGILSSDPVVSTSATSDATLGEIGGRLGTFDSNSKMITYMAKEHGTLMAIMVIKPERNYQSGVDKMFLRKNYLDMYFKYLTGIGNQAISLQEVLSCINGIHFRGDNWGFTSRFEEFRHSKNRIVSRCRNNNMIIHALKTDNGGIVDDTDMTLAYARTNGYDVPYENVFHPYAIGDAYCSSSIATGTGALQFGENAQTFLLCLPQLNDIFVDDTIEPFLTVVGFKMDMLSPIPSFTSPGVNYV